MNLQAAGLQAVPADPLRGAGWLILAIGLTVAFGWLIDSTTLVRVAPGLPSMKFATAVCLVLLGGAMLLARRGLSAALLTLCLLAGATGLIMLMFAITAEHSDVALPAALPESVMTPMPPLVAAAIVLAAGGLVLLDRGRTLIMRRASAACGLLVTWFGLYGVIELPLRGASGVAMVYAANIGLHTLLCLLMQGGALFGTALGIWPGGNGATASGAPSPGWTQRVQRDWVPLMAFLTLLTAPLYVARLLGAQQVAYASYGSLPLMVAAVGALAALLVAIATQAALTARWQGHLAQRSNAAARRAREALRASHQRFEAVARATTDAVWDWDVVADKLWWNEGYATLFGHRTEERERSLVTWQRHIHPSDRERVLASLGAALAGAAMHWSEQYRFARGDGSWTEVADRGVIFRQSGRAVRMIGGMSDISEQTEARRILRDRQRFFEVSLELLAISRTDGTMLQVNPAFERVLGWSQEEILTQTFYALLHPDDLSVARAVVARLTKGESVHHFAIRSRCKSGVYLWFEWSISPEENGVLYCAGHEITERKIGEARLRRMIVRLEAGTRELQDLGQVAAHDLAGPLQRLRADVAALGALVVRQGEPAALENFRHAEQALARLQAMLGELLTYSRIGSEGRQFEAVDLDGVVADVLEDLGEPIKRSGSRIEKKRLPVINADPGQMRLLFHNLIGHSLRVHRPGIAPRLLISANTIAPDTEGAEEMVSIIVEASALQAAHQERRAVPLQVGLERGKRRASGISLAIARRIVARHHGSLAVHSDPTAGARFDVRLPRALKPLRL